MNDYDTSTATGFMRRLLDDNVAASLEEIARLPAGERRAAIADPTAFLRDRNLQPPEGITLKIREETLEPRDLPEELRGKLPPIPRIVLICIISCWFEFKSGPDGVRLVRRCMSTCIQV